VLGEFRSGATNHFTARGWSWALAAPPAQVTEYDTEDDDQHCGNAIPGNDRPWIAGINVADDPVPGKHDPQHDQGGNYQAPLAG